MILKGDGFIIRPIQRTEADLASILAVYRACEDFLALGPVATASAEMVQADLVLSEQHGGMFCAIEDVESGEMLGIVDYVLAGFEGDPNAADLSLLMIAAPHRGRGLGEAVVRLVEAHIAQNEKIAAIHAGVQVNNPGAIRFWQRMGYTIVSEAELMPDGTTAYQLNKPLFTQY